MLRILRCISFSDRVKISSPSSMISPPVILPLSEISRRMERAVSDFPQPDSPTIPNISPCFTQRLTPSTAGYMPPPEGKETHKSLIFNTSKTLPLSVFWIRPVADGIAQQIDAQHHQENGSGGGDDIADGAVYIVFRVGEHRAPGRFRRLDAHAQKA